MPRRIAFSFRWPTPLLLLVNIAGVVACVLQFVHGSQAHSIAATVADKIAAPTPLSDPTLNSIDLSGIQNAALFYEARGFYVPPVVPELQTRPDYRLSGTLLIPNQPAVAMLIQNQSGARLKIREGQELEGWTVFAIRPQGVTLRHGEQELEIRSVARAASQGLQAVALNGVIPASRSPGSGLRVLGNSRAAFPALAPPQSAPRSDQGPIIQNVIEQNTKLRPLRPPG